MGKNGNEFLINTAETMLFNLDCSSIEDFLSKISSKSIKSKTSLKKRVENNCIYVAVNQSQKIFQDEEDYLT